MPVPQRPWAGKVFSASPLTELKPGPRDTPSMKCRFKANSTANKSDKWNLPHDITPEEEVCRPARRIKKG
jgi:hypothetical protein